MTANSSSVSCGVSTAVGSSRIEHLGVPHQGLDDLDALLHADRQVLHQGVGVHRQAEALRDLHDVPAGPPPVQPPERPPVVLGAQHHVLGDREDRDQHEVLVDHADAGRDRVPGAGTLGSPSTKISPSSGW